jgi:hypothetical protein
MNTKEEFFEFERQNRKSFDDYYRQKGWSVERIYGKENKKYDCRVKANDRWIKIEEKAASYDYGGCLVELTQDLETNDKGWLYTCEADYLLFKMLDKLYWVDMNKLKVHMRECGADYESKISTKGWGQTLFVIIPWSIIIGKGIGNEISRLESDK